LCPDRHDPNSSINKAKNLSKTDDFINLDQYSNPNNPHGHYKITGEQIIKQLKHAKINLDFFFAAVGTTGTIVGTTKRLREYFTKCKTIGVASADDITRLGTRSISLLEEIDFDWKSYVNEIVEVDTESAFLNSLKLIKKGLFVGPSTGHIYTGVLNYINEHKLSNVNIVFIACDTFFPYVDEYIKNIDSENLASILNEEYAITYAHIQSKIKGKNYEDYKISVENFIIVYNNLLASDIVIDVRKESEFLAFRLAKVQKLHMHDIEEDVIGLVNYLSKYQKVYILDCGMSDTSKLACLILREKGINSFWIEGGMDKIYKNFPNLIVKDQN